MKYRICDQNCLKVYLKIIILFDISLSILHKHNNNNIENILIQFYYDIRDHTSKSFYDQITCAGVRSNEISAAAYINIV